MLKQRILTAVLGLPLFIWMLAKGEQWMVGLFFLVCVGFCTYEISHMILPKLDEVFSGEKASPVPPMLVRIYTFVGMVVFLGSCFEEWAKPLIAVAFINILILPAFFNHPRIEVAMGRILGCQFSLAYGVLPWFAMWELYKLGVTHFIFLLMVSWFGDTGGYFGGRFLGKRKMAESISPKKTWEGAICGLIASTGAAFFCHYLLGLPRLELLLLASVLGGIAGQIGDLFESICKRFSGVKDSGHVFPGHGGFLDRVDAVIFAAPIIWLLFLGFT
jgi:phosphatidate cytidylyltransferase